DTKFSFRAIDFDGIEDRLLVLPVAAGAYNHLGMTANRVIYAGGGTISFYDLNAKSGGTLAPGGSFELSSDGSKLLTGSRVVDANGRDLPITAGALSFGGLKLSIDPKKEWEEEYWDAWRLLRDYFYVANMNGVDWDAIGKKYGD